MPGRCRFGALFCTLLAAFPSAVADDGRPTRAEVAKRGKAATALVVADNVTGSAFCVHPAGLFVTNDHVVRAVPAGKGVKLVLDAALKTQRVLDARVVRSDPAQDLALLRADGAGEFPRLAVGPADGLSELAEVIAFGFPFGTALSSDRREYPSVSVNVCAVSALRLKAGVLDRIDLNGSVNPGQSGGPLLDLDGKVVGVIVSGIRGAGLAQAIPSPHLVRFLAKPDIDFTPPRLDAAAAGRPVTFRVRVDSPLPVEEPPEVELTLAGAGPSRTQKMALRGGWYESTLVPVPRASGPRRLDVTARFAGGTVIVSPVTDREVKVGGRPVALREVSQLRPGDAGQATRTDGSTLAGKVEGLEAVEVRVGGRAVALDLGAAESVQVATGGGPPQLTAVFVVTAGGKEVARASAAVPVGGPGAAQAVAGVPNSAVPGAAMSQAALEGDTVVRKLPAAFSDVAVGGNGRYLILFLPQQRKLAVFDVPAARVAGYIAVDEDEVKFTAGMDKLVVALPAKGLLQRWDLATRERELTVLAGTGSAKFVAMGHASAGPVLVHWVGGTAGTEFLDLKTLKPLPVRNARNDANFGIGPDNPIRASADGQTFGFWSPGTSPQGCSTLALRGLTAYHSGTGESVGHMQPGPDGKVIYSARGRFTAECKRLDELAGGRPAPDYSIPAAHGNYYLGLSLDGGGTGPLGVFLAGDKRPLVRVPLPEGLPTINGWDREPLGLDRRLVLVPDAKVLVALPKTNDEVVLRRFDVDEALEKSGVDYLIVTSTPPAAVKRGAEFRYQATAKAKKGGVTFRLESGPDGMQVTPDGAVTWAVPADAGEKEASVIVTARDAAGQEAFHTFTLKLE